MSLSIVASSADDFVAGPLFSQFSLTLDVGHRTEAVGPFFYTQEKNSEKTWAIPPLFSHDTDPDVESREDDLLYPLLTYDRFGTEYRWQLGQLLSFAGGEDAQDFQVKRFTLFPVYFQQRSLNTNENYTALVPFYGHLQNRLFRDRIFFVMFPIYSETQKKDVVTENYLYPFFDVSHGDGMHGWQFWPLFGTRHKEVTTQTNGFGEIETIAGYDKFFALWPIYFYQNTGIGTDDLAKFRASLPFYATLRSPKRDSTSVLWPFFSWIDDREAKYHEWQGPYPFVVVARGAGKTVTRVWPLFSQALNDSLESDYYLWPLYRYDRLHSGALDFRQTHILLYLFANVTENNMDTGAWRRRVDLWPLFEYNRDFSGNKRLQILAPIEPILPNNRGVERNWSPL
ncbi:MAG TPA: hypothetical protein VMA13_08610, partial [Candidatus Saccharimonadales bacterium]|nr:hypothetical protein [Candidatus Saccharimonadales bacterium]